MATASGLISSIQSISTNLLRAIRGAPSTSHQQQDPSSPVTDQHKSVRDDLEKLSRMLARIQAVQQDAEEREIHNCSVRLWLAELRGVAYQAEDVLDEFYYEVLRSIVESGDAAIEAYHTDGGSKRKFDEMYTSSSLASKVLIPDGMAEKIKGITERLEEISNARRDLHLKEEDGTRLAMDPQIRPPTSSNVDERAIFGREEEKEEIISLLDPSNGPDFMVIPIVGMGGFGKTTLAQLVFNDSRIHGLFNNRCWVSVSEDFDLVRLTKAIVESVSNSPCQFSELSKLQDVLKENIRGLGLFLVLDDVWNENRDLWERFRVGFFGAKFVRILTTTRNTSVAKIMQTASPFQLSSLPEENCWSLFKHFAFGNRETSENANLHKIGCGIAEKCKGSLLAIKPLGGILNYEMDEKIKGITERFEEVSNDHMVLQLREEDGTRLVSGPQNRPPSSSHVDKRVIFGREKEKENIISLLNPLNDPEFMVLPIIGMGGLGKTTLAQLVYNDSRFFQLFDKRAWVSVSEDFDLVRLTRAIIESINRTTCEFSELSILQDILKEKISDVSLFLVLDDMWNEKKELWEHFQVPFKGGKTVKILITTRNTSVAEIMQTTSPIQLDCLPNEKCWSLFKNFALENGEASENANFLEIGRGIFKKCKGSPLVTKVLGGILRYDMDEEKWREVLESDISEIDESGKIFTPLQLSYQKLPLHLKPCFVYLAMFPKGKLIEKDHVVRLWMAQGYINSNSRTKKTLEEIGSEYLNELQGRSLIDCGDYNTCYVHDLIHDLARSISERTNQSVLENDNLWNSSYKITHLYLTEKHELSGVLASCNNKVIRTYVRENPIKYIDDSAIFSKITYVRALQVWTRMLPDTFTALKHLRYLSIEDYRIEKSLPESLCLLYHLQTLDVKCPYIPELPENIKSLINLRFLRLCSDRIKQLPESISLLHNLDTLSIEPCSNLEKLPGSIEKLTNLRVLKLSKFLICNLPSGIGKLTNLVTLSGHFKVMGTDMTLGLGELRDMNRLSGSMSISGLKNIGSIEYSRKTNLVSKSNLRKLILNFEEDDGAHKSFPKYGNPDLVFYIAVSSSTNAKNENDGEIQEGVLESLQPHGNLTELVILNYRGRRVPHWLLDPSLMSKLRTLTLHLKREFLLLPPFLDQLLHLKYLKIYWSCGSEIQLGNYSSKQPAGVSFSSHEPSFNNMLNSGEWQAGDEPCLMKLFITKCPKLWEITIPEKVEVLEVNGCGCQEIKFSSHSELKRLSISNCRELVTIHSEIKRLSISNCREFVTIYYKSGDLPFFESISLSGCPNFLMLSDITQELKQLDIADCGFREINFSPLSKLQKISIFSCRELVSIYYGDLPFLESISLSGCPKLLIFSAILEDMKQKDKRNSGSQSEIQNVSDCTEFIPPSLGRVSLSNCPKLRIFSAIPAVELDTLKIVHCGIHKIFLPSRCQLLEIDNCPDLNSVHWRDGDSSSLPLVKFVDCPKLKHLKIPKEVEALKIKSCGTQEISFSSQSKVRSVDIYGCPELLSVNWMDGDVPFLKDLFFEGCPELWRISVIPNKIHQLGITECGLHEIQFPKQCNIASAHISGCPELISLQFLQGDLPLLEKFAIKYCPQFHEVLTIPYQLKELEIVDCRFPEIHLLPQSKLQRLIISECANLTAIKGLQFPMGDVSHSMMEMVEIRNCPRMDFGTQGNSYFYQVTQEASLDLGTEEP